MHFFFNCKIYIFQINSSDRTHCNLFVFECLILFSSLSLLSIQLFYNHYCKIYLFLCLLIGNDILSFNNFPQTPEHLFTHRGLILR